jgi:molybdopterin-containing oxidoreductase family membrane subunit
MFSFIISIVVNIGMWFERFVIIVTSFHRDYLPSWTMFSPTFVDIGILEQLVSSLYFFYCMLELSL